MPKGSPKKLGFDADRLERIAPAMQALVDANEISGVVMAIARNGRVIYRGSVGYADSSSKVPMGEDTVFRIHSMTKPITSVAAMILVEEGKLTLEDPVSKYVPVIGDMKVYVSGEGVDVVVEDQKQAMTVRHLLTHTSGIPLPVGPTPAHKFYAEVWPEEIRPLSSFAEELATKPLIFQPGTRFMYGMSTDVLSYVVEVASGQPFEDFVAERITGPLGMDETVFVMKPDQKDRLATFYEVADGGLAPSSNFGADLYDNPGRMPSGGGGLLSTVADYLRFSQMLLNDGRLEDVKILSPRSVELMRRNHLTNDQKTSEGSGFGLGFAIYDDPGIEGTMLSQGSYYWGGLADTHFWIDPEQKIVAIAMTQRFGPGFLFRDTMRALTYQALGE